MENRIYADYIYIKFRDRLLENCVNTASTCPFCEEPYEDIAEYVDVGVGGHGVQVTPNYCAACGASQTGHYELDPSLYEFKCGWHRAIAAVASQKHAI